MVQKGSTEGQIAPSQGSSSGPEMQTQGIDASKMKMGAPNISKARIPTAISELGGQISGVEKSVQDEANNFASNAGKQSFTLDSDTLGKAAKGDPEAKSKATGILGLNPEVESAKTVFKPTTNTAVKNAAYLQPGATVLDLVRGQAPKLSSGGVKFQTQLLEANPAFQNIMGSLRQGYSGFDARLKAIQDNAQKQAQETVKGNITAGQAGTKQALAKMQDNIVAAAQGKAAEENSKRQGDVSGDHGDFLLNSATEAKTDLDAELLKLGISPDVLQGYVPQLNDYFIAPGQAGEGEYYSDDDVGQYGNIMDLLGVTGQGGKAIATAPKSHGVGFDKGAYINNMINEAMKRKNAAGDAELARQASLSKVKMPGIISEDELGGYTPPSPIAGTQGVAADAGTFQVDGPRYDARSDPNSPDFNWEFAQPKKGVTSPNSSFPAISGMLQVPVGASGGTGEGGVVNPNYQTYDGWNPIKKGMSDEKNSIWPV